MSDKGDRGNLMEFVNKSFAIGFFFFWSVLDEFEKRNPSDLRHLEPFPVFQRKPTKLM